MTFRLFLSGLILVLLTICTSCNGDTTHSSPTYVTTECDQRNSDNLILQLTSYNANLNNESNYGNKSRSTNVNMDDIKIGLADAKGAYEGFCRWGPLGIVAGAVLYSILAAIIIIIESFTTETTNKSTIKEIIYSVEYNNNTIQQAANDCADIKLGLPSEYEDIKTAAIKHNAILYMFSDPKNAEIHALPTEQIPILSSVEFDNMYNSIITSEGSKLWEPINNYGIENSIFDTELRILNLFNEACEGYCQSIHDMEKITNSYIVMIEEDWSLSNDSKERIYTYLTIASYSYCYWNKYLNTFIK